MHRGIPEQRFSGHGNWHGSPHWYMDVLGLELPGLWLPSWEPVHINMRFKLGCKGFKHLEQFWGLRNRA